MYFFSTVFCFNPQEGIFVSATVHSATVHSATVHSATVHSAQCSVVNS